MMHMGKNRCRMEILSDIIESAREGAKRTHIMYRANLSYEQVFVYVDLLVKKDMLVMRAESKYYPTEAGLNFSNTVRNVVEMVSMEVNN